MTSQTRRIALTRRPQTRPIGFALRPDRAEMDALARDLGLDGLRKLSLTGQLQPENSRDWRLEARLGATVTQLCVVTLAPVTTRLEETVIRRYLAEMPTPAPTEGQEVEMPEDDTIEPLPDHVDLSDLLAEALALALPLYPRAEGAGLGTLSTAEPGVAPLTDDQMRPFDGLAGLRDRLRGDD